MCSVSHEAERFGQISGLFRSAADRLDRLGSTETNSPAGPEPFSLCSKEPERATGFRVIMGSKSSSHHFIQVVCIYPEDKEGADGISLNS